MDLFLDTANLKEIKEGSEWGFLKGVTTNPSLIAKEGRKQKDIISEIVKMVDGPISAEVTANDSENRIKQGHELYQLDPKHIVIKLPITMDGLKACSVLHKEGIPTNRTLCFSVSQALLARESGATYVSPFLGRLDDNGWDSKKLIQDLVTLKKANGYTTKIICASIRNVAHVETCALLGADIATIPYKVMVKLVKHPLTDAGLESFAKAAEETAKLK